MARDTAQKEVAHTPQLQAVVQLFCGRMGPARRSASGSGSPRAAEALAANANLDGTALEVEVSGSSATVAGSVESHRQRKTAEKVLSGVSGITSVDASSVTVTARTRGTTHEIKRGDTLSHVAYQYYGEHGKTKHILKANRGLKASNMQIGQLVKIPAID